MSCCYTRAVLRMLAIYATRFHPSNKLKFVGGGGWGWGGVGAKKLVSGLV